MCAWIDRSEPGWNIWEYQQDGDVYQLRRDELNPILIVATKNGFFLARFIARGMELAKEFTEVHLIDAAQERDDL